MSALRFDAPALEGPELDQLMSEQVFLFHSVPDNVRPGTLYVLDRDRLDPADRRLLELLARKAFRPAVRSRG